jgi:chemotaxis protein MotA
MDRVTIFGLILGIGGILLGNMIEGGQTASLIHGAAGIIVLAGTIGATLVASRQRDVKQALELFKKAFQKETDEGEQKVLREIVELARLAKKETLLALEPKVEKIVDPFMRSVFRAVVDAIDGNVIRQTFENQIEVEEERRMNGAKVWLEAGGYAPTIGIIGAVLGLINVMGNLTETSKLGAGIAVAFVATVYGVGFANLVFIPIGSKLKKRVSKEMRIYHMMLEGALCIQANLQPSIVEIRLRGYVEKD